MVFARCLVVDEDPGRWTRFVRVEQQGVSDDRRSRLRWPCSCDERLFDATRALSVAGPICWDRDMEQVGGICDYVKTSRYWNKESGGYGGQMLVVRRMESSRANTTPSAFTHPSNQGPSAIEARPHLRENTCTRHALCHCLFCPFLILKNDTHRPNIR